MRLMMIEVICSLYKPDLEILGLPQVVFFVKMIKDTTAERSTLASRHLTRKTDLT